MGPRPIISFALAGLLLAGLLIPAPRTADLALINGTLWTVDEKLPRAEALAAKGDFIIAVGKNSEIKKYIGPETQVIDLKGNFALPGFNDTHVHFQSAGALLLGVNLLDVSDAESFATRIRQATERLPAGSWITGGEWGAYEQWALGSAGAERSKAKEPFKPSKHLIDSFTGNHPVLVNRFDRKVYLANSLALKLAGIDGKTPDPPGGAIERDENGEPTGILTGSAAELVRKVIPPPSRALLLAQAHRALEELRRHGVTSVHDMSPPNQLDIYQELIERGQLTVRINYRPTLDKWQSLADIGIKAGFGSHMMRLGALKGFVDGIMGNSTALFFEPYEHDPGNSGRLREMMLPEGNMERLVLAADRAGLQVTVHAIGDKANRIILDIFEKAIRENGPRDRRFRVVHAQVVHPDDLPRFGKLGLIAEVQPYHAIDDMRWMEERIGRRARYAYAFRSLTEAGAVLAFGSDWPGTNASYYPVNPLLGIYAAVTRQTIKGEPAGGWFPEERLSIEEAIKCYTLNPAYAGFEEKTKGSLTAGKLADLVVLSKNILNIPPRQLLETEVLYTILGGKIVYQKGR